MLALLRWSLYAVVAFHLLCFLGLLYVGLFNPPVTAVQVQRRIESWFEEGTYRKNQNQVPLSRLSAHLQWAIVAAEDGRFYEHRGIDWEELKVVGQESWARGSVGRGGSTITQQLVKNLFLTTRRSFLRKGLEFTLAPMAEMVLPKKRILELYLNVIEWGPGVYGAEAAARYHYRTGADRLSRERAARLAAIVPDPRRRTPDSMDRYAARILERMTGRGW
jgi:monofunctional glycosyltransferase